MIREIFGKKIGMTQLFNEEGDLDAVTLVEVEPARILEKVEYPTKTVARIGVFELPEKKKHKVKKPVLGYFEKLGLPVYRMVKETAVEADADFSFLDGSSRKTPSQEASSGASAKEDAPDGAASETDATDRRYAGVNLFAPGEIVDVRANTKGRGFAGGMKRHNWSGQPGSHGSTMHRRLGSAGANSSPSKIWKGLGMPGRMGNWKRTVRNLKIVKIDEGKNLLFIRGHIPGARGVLVKIIKVK